jgi:hypothetical protein
MSELVVITTYYNPCRWESRRKNYDLFMDGMREQGVACITIECAFGDAAFELTPSLDVIQIRSKTLLWQKERLLNLAASWLPKSCKYVAWLDCDILFDNKNWGRDLCRLLRTHKVAQVFETCTRLEKGNVVGDTPDVSESFASVMGKTPETLDVERYDAHGHTGYGLAHAIYGDYNFCITNALKSDPRQISHLKAWGSRFYEMVQGSLCVVPGHIRHLWHGDAVDRRYFLRMHDITREGFDPWTDLHIEPGAPIEWAPDLNKPGLVQYFTNYFASRREDGVLAE